MTNSMAFEEIAGPVGLVRFVIPPRGWRLFAVTACVPLIWIATVFIASGFELDLLWLLTIVPFLMNIDRKRCFAKTEVSISRGEISLTKTLGRYSKKPTAIGVNEVNSIEFEQQLFNGPYSWKSLFHNMRFSLGNPFVYKVMLKDSNGCLYCICDYMKYEDRKLLSDRLKERLNEAQEYCEDKPGGGSEYAG